MKSTQRRNLSDQVASQIRDYIVGNRLGPGDRLPTEHQLADKFGVSRVSVREATRALGFLGIVDAAPRRGLHVGRVDMERVSEFLGFHLAICDYPADQLIETRIVLETGALPHLMKRMAKDETIAERLQTINDDLRKTSDLPRFIELDIAFHRELVDSCGLKPLVAFSDLMNIFFQRFRESVRQAEWEDGLNSHQRMIDALTEGRLEDACEEVRGHIESHKERVK